MKKLIIVFLFAINPAFAGQDLLNVSYDVTREFYKDFNTAFSQHWLKKTGESVVINQSHGGSTKQARSVIDGLNADIISMNRSADIDILAEKAGLIPNNWASRLPNESVATASPTVFLVRKNNPKNIRDWSDLVREDVSVIVPNPKTSGNGKYTYLGAWGYVIKNGGNTEKAKSFVAKLFSRVPVLDSGGRGATTTFGQRDIGDVLVTFENEAFLIQKELGQDKFLVVYPTVTILAENPIALVDKVVDKKNTRKLAQAYLEYHFSTHGQAIAAKHFLRPQIVEISERTFPKVTTFTVKEIFGSWNNAEKTHFTDGALFDQLYQNK